MNQSAEHSYIVFYVLFVVLHKVFHIIKSVFVIVNVDTANDYADQRNNNKYQINQPLCPSSQFSVP